MKFRSFVRAAALGAAFAIGGATAALGQNSAQEEAAIAEARAATIAQLSRPITIELTDARLEDIVQFLRDFTGANIEPMWVEDQYDGLQKDQRLTISANNSTVLAFLERVLERTQSDFSPNTWQFTRDGAGIEIGPKNRLNSRAYLKLYDVNDLLYQIPDFTEAPQLDLDQVLNQGQQGSSGASGGIFQDEGDDNGGQGLSPRELIDQMIEIITENVEPEQWLTNGGSGGTVRYYNGYLMVRAPNYIHRQLEGYPAPTKPAAQHAP